MSSIKIPADEVFRLAEASIADIKSTRQRVVNEALEIVSKQRCTKHWFWSHQKYSSREEALRYAPEVIWAQKYAITDENTCKMLRSMAKYVLEDEHRTNKTITITRDDFRALT